jgi:hypothetical protein
MTVKTAKEWIEDLKALDPDEPLWVLYVERSDMSDEVDTFVSETVEYDENDKPLFGFDVDKDFTTELFKDIVDKLNNDDYLWETYNTTVDDCMRDVMGDYVKEKSSVVVDDKSLWEE